MIRRPALAIALLSLALASGLGLTGCSAEPDAPPNLVVILLDDADVRDFAFHAPESAIALPRIEALAASGLVFDRFYASSPVCSPTRAALLTGQYPARYGLNHVIRHDSPRGLPARAPSLAGFLRERGYATAHVGKWHLGTQRPEYRPEGRGFARRVTTGRWRGFFRTELFVDAVAQPPAPERHLDARLTDEALRFIREQRDAPFFLNLWYFTPHVPNQPPPEFADQYASDEAGRYAAQMAHIDFQIGRLLDGLETLELAERTAVVLMSDNGGTSAVHAGTHGDVRGGKKGVLEGGIRSPLLVRWPERTLPGTRSERLTVTMDLFPTIVDALGGEAAAMAFDGRSFADALTTRTAAQGEPDRGNDRRLFWEVRATQTAVPQFENLRGALRMFAVREGRWKLATTARRLELYDLATDPGETVDRSAEHPERVAALLDAYRDWRLDTATIPTRVADPGGATRSAGDLLEFEAPGAATLAPDELFDPADGDLSCRFTLRLDPPSDTPGSGEASKLPDTPDGEPKAATPPKRSRVIGKGDAWSLWLDEAGRLELQRAGSEPLRSEQPLAPGREYDVAVSLMGLQSSRLTRVFVDATVALHAHDEVEIPPDAAPLTLGGDGDAQLRGAIVRPACLALGLTLRDLAPAPPPEPTANAPRATVPAPSEPALPEPATDEPAPAR